MDEELRKNYINEITSAKHALCVRFAKQWNLHPREVEHDLDKVSEGEYLQFVIS